MIGMPADEFMVFVAEQLKQKRGTLPNPGQGGHYNSLEGDYDDECGELAYRLESSITHFRWGVEFVIGIPQDKDFKPETREEENSGLMLSVDANNHYSKTQPGITRKLAAVRKVFETGPVIRGYVNITDWRDQYFTAYTDFATVTHVRTSMNKEEVPDVIGMPLGHALEKVLSTFDRYLHTH